jgi:hypothetical protein
MLLSRRRIIQIFKEHDSKVSLNSVFDQWLRTVDNDIYTSLKIILSRDGLGAKSAKQKLSRLVRRRERLAKLVNSVDPYILYKDL